jgi:membrane-bound inhibitor of C-type lysozyme
MYPCQKEKISVSRANSGNEGYASIHIDNKMISWMATGKQRQL